MKEMAKHVPDTGSYAPVTVLVDDRSDGRISLVALTRVAARDNHLGAALQPKFYWALLQTKITWRVNISRMGIQVLTGVG